jgi:hypothetical protein
VVADHHQPEKLDCPRYEENPRHGDADSNAAVHDDDHGPDRTSPSADRYSTQTWSVARTRAAATAAMIRTVRAMPQIE